MSATMLLVNLLGAVALLLWGMRMVRTGAQRAFGNGLQAFLSHWLRNRFAAFGAGLGVTALVQSSTATCLMTADFAARGIVALPVALAIMLGADVATSLIAQVFSFDISWLSPILLFGGFLLHASSKGKRPQNAGRIFIGLGLILLALGLIVASSEPLRASPTVPVIVGALDGEPLIAILLAAVLTWLAHSSLATVLLVCSLAATGAIPVGLALTLVLGANFGGALPPFLATLHGPREGRMVAVGNGLFKLTGCVIALPLLGLIQPYLATFDPDPVRMAVNMHTLFNLGLAVLFLPVVGLAAKLVERLIKDQDEGQPQEMHQRNLGYEEGLDPAISLANASREVLRMGDLVDAMLADSMAAVREGGDPEVIAEIARRDDQIDRVYEAVKLYLAAVRRESLDEQESLQCGEIMAFCTNLEHIGDIAENLVDLAVKKEKRGLRFSPEGESELDQLFRRVHNNLRLALGVFISGEMSHARKLIQEKDEVRNLEKVAAENHYQRLEQGRPEAIETSAMHLDIIRDLKRINAHLTSVAYPILDSAGELRSSRLKKKRAETSSKKEGATLA
ncbi:Na/Pi cotransporter family protein [Aestuariispira insulae]|uniref:Phosphate:Na+ symporter n=1 Tax=Aestuariispira insulae TaxID=1461337 RepID=A0A3D9HJP6_9PROT|nr:Na/Pi cotransporter family protein [Aestuariispira insulae]RED49683.1 phosphate:Na+ symporter [Aestuariispira insulae]